MILEAMIWIVLSTVGGTAVLICIIKQPKLVRTIRDTAIAALLIVFSSIMVFSIVEWSYQPLALTIILVSTGVALTAHLKMIWSN